VAVASPAYMKGRRKPATPADLAAMDGILMRSAKTGRVRLWTLRNAAGATQTAELPASLVFNDPAAIAQAAVLGLGAAMIAMADALPYLERGELVRVLPKWYADAGPISLYYASRNLLPGKTRAFVDYVTEAFKQQGLAERLAGSLG